jgi:hypothetical protein
MGITFSKTLLDLPARVTNVIWFCIISWAKDVKAILPGGIILVEKIRNVYDQDEYLETVLPVSSE